MGTPPVVGVSPRGEDAIIRQKPGQRHCFGIICQQRGSRDTTPLNQTIRNRPKDLALGTPSLHLRTVNPLIVLIAPLAKRRNQMIVLRGF